MRVVIALGGNALVRRNEPITIDVQRRNLAAAAIAVTTIAAEHEVVVTHGNGPQVGLLALQAQAYHEVPPYPLDVLGAESEGMIGYLIEQELRSRLPDRDVVTLLTQVEVDGADPAFLNPTKPIGPVYTRGDAERLASERGWHVAADGTGWRRVVPSPEPHRILELGAIRTLVEAGALVVCAGGGGVPVVVTPGGGIRGVEAVIDKDLATALLARAIRADALLLLTDVNAIYRDWHGKRTRPIGATTPGELRSLGLDAGSMAPKAEAACRFVEAGGAIAGIGALRDASAILAGTRGTQVRRALGDIPVPRRHE
jgi:carbamate kinase